MWPNNSLIELLDIEFPIVQAPMAGAMDWELAAAAAEAGALGSLPCAMLNADRSASRWARSAPARRSRSTSASSVIRRRCPTTSVKRAGARRWRPTIASSASIPPRRCP